MTIKLTEFDPAKYLDSEEAITEFLKVTQEEHPELMDNANEVVARARAMHNLP